MEHSPAVISFIEEMVRANPLGKNWSIQVDEFGPGRASIVLSAQSAGRPSVGRFAGPNLFAVADMVGCLALWHLAQDMRSVFTTNFSWNCYKPVRGRALRIDANVLGSTLNLATVELTVLVKRRNFQPVATALATVYLRRRQNA